MLKKSRTSFLIGLFLLMFAIVYANVSGTNVNNNVTTIRQKSGWTISCETNNNCLIFDNNGKVLGYIKIDNKGKVSLTVIK